MNMTKTVETVERMNTSQMGNPRYRVRFTDGTVLATKPDSTVAYMIDNSEYRDVPVDVETNGNGDIVNIKVAGQ